MAACRPLNELGLPAPLLAALAQQRISHAGELLALGPVELAEACDTTPEAARGLLRAVAQQVAPPFATAAALLAERRAAQGWLPTPLPALDAALRGGVPFGGVTELVGPAGVGKSQWCLALTLRAALPQELGGLGGGVMYVDTEGKFSSTRLSQMARAAAPKELSSDAALHGVLDRVGVLSPRSPEELLAALSVLEAAIVPRQVRLVVVDSIAALVRVEFEPGRAGLAERGAALGAQASALKRLAESFRIAVVVTNQVAARIQPAALHAFQGTGGPLAGPSEGGLQAALGPTWAHCVNTRLVLERQGPARYLRIAKSPASAAAAFGYAVTGAGVEPDDSAPALQAAAQSVLALDIANYRDEY